MKIEHGKVNWDLHDMSESKVKKLFGKEALMMYRGGQLAVKSHGSRRFKFEDAEVFAELLHKDMPLAQEMYFRETLYRCFLASQISLMRSDSWLKNVLRAHETGQALLFCASLRGLLESCGDSIDITGVTMLTLADNHEIICEALAGNASKITLMQEFEDKLIHFTHARKLTKQEKESYPESHKAKQIFQYIDNLNAAAVPRAKECYAELCDFTHPGQSSLLPWVSEIDDTLETHTNRDQLIIKRLLKEYKELFVPLFRVIYNPTLMALNLLNHFPLEAVHSPYLLKQQWSNAPGWVKANLKLQNSRYYRPASYATE